MLDIYRAFFNAKTDPDQFTYVALPSEHTQHETPCGLPMRHMYGTQAAPDRWKHRNAETLVDKMGFVHGVASPCVFKNEERQHVCSVHGDDFTTAGPKSSLDWF